MVLGPRRALAALLFVSLALACGEEPPPPATDEPDDVTAEPEDAGTDAGPGRDAGPPRPPARLFAKRFVSKIRVSPDRESFRIGYLRAGAVVMATTGEPVRTGDPRCRGGWYELTTGGFVCNGRDVIAFWGRRPPAARGTQANRTTPLPYEYGRTRGAETPMYRDLPTDEQAAEFEGFQIPGLEPTPPPEGGAVADPANPPAAGGETAPVVALVPPAPEADSVLPPTPSAEVDADPDAEDEEEPVTLASLQGERDSVLLRRMVSGFIVSLDRDFRAGPNRRRYWRTINNGFVPYHSVSPVTFPEFQGARLDDMRHLPVAYVMGRTEASFLRTPDGRARRGAPAGFQDRLHVIGEETIQGTHYFVGADERLYREQDVRVIQPRARPAEVGVGEKWIEVNLTQQYLIAYEGDLPVYVTLISSGRAFHPDDPTANFLTPTGIFRIRAKHLASAMDGDTAADGPYSIDDVPWVMYFQLAYALHGAFWHQAFGFPRSHGCVNLAPRDAQWVFNWSDPQLPEGWHGVYPPEDGPGTWILIHGETPGSRSP